MTETNADSILVKAQEKCRQTGGKLTDKRQEILKILLNAGTALSAYDIVEQYNRNQEKSIQPMSVYRILDFLVSENLAHKLSVANQYIACEHISCDHAHSNSHFLICKNCQKVKEVYLEHEVVEQLANNIEAAGYHLTNSQLELKCLCDECEEELQTAG